MRRHARQEARAAARAVLLFLLLLLLGIAAILIGKRESLISGAILVLWGGIGLALRAKRPGSAGRTTSAHGRQPHAGRN